MATINHVTMANQAPTSTAAFMNNFWRLTRAQMKAGWKYMGSGDGTTKDTSKNPQNNLWNGTPGVVGGVTNAGGSGAVVAASTDTRRSSVTGLSGIVDADKGRFFVDTTNGKSYQIEEITSPTEVRVDARSVAVTVGTVNWEIRDPTNDTYPSGTVGAASSWVLYQGPSILRVPISSPPADSKFVLGENLVQAATGAQGELYSIIWDAVTGAGWLTVLPRVQGSGAGRRGWDSSEISGELSRARITPSATIIEYIVEMSFRKLLVETTGSWFWGMFDAVADTADMMSVKMLSAGCTATVAPTAGGGGNGTSPQVATVFGLSGSSNPLLGTVVSARNAQISCADTIEEAYHSADGTFTIAHSNVIGTSPSDVYIYSFQFCENPAPGELDPYWFYTPGTAAANTSGWGSLYFIATGQPNQNFNGFGIACYGRAIASANADYCPAFAYVPHHFVQGVSADVQVFTGGNSLFWGPTGGQQKIPAYSQPTVQAISPPVFVFSGNYYNAEKYCKGNPRWMRLAHHMQWMTFTEVDPQDGSSSGYGFLCLGAYEYQANTWNRSRGVGIGPWSMTAPQATGGA